MSIIQKVKSRKIAFLYYYQHHFVSRIDRYDISESISEDPIIDIDLIQSILQQQDRDPVVYIAQSQLWYQISDYDDHLAYMLIDAYHLYADQMQDIISPYTKTFVYTEMNAIDQSLLHLWYTEYVSLHTPYKIIIDQMVEIAKRYSAPSSAKLINGILHALLSVSESWKASV